MAVMAIFTVKGDTTKLLASYDKAIPRLAGLAPAKPLSHICVPSDTGIKIVDVWQSEEVLQDFAQNPGFHQVLQETGLPEPDVEVAPVHRLGW